MWFYWWVGLQFSSWQFRGKQPIALMREPNRFIDSATGWKPLKIALTELGSADLIPSTSFCKGTGRSVCLWTPINQVAKSSLAAALLTCHVSCIWCATTTSSSSWNHDPPVVDEAVAIAGRSHHRVMMMLVPVIGRVRHTACKSFSSRRLINWVIHKILLGGVHSETHKTHFVALGTLYFLG